MIEQFRTIHGGAIAVDFNAIAVHFPAGLPDSGISRLNKAAQLSGFGNPFREGQTAQTRQKLAELMQDEVFRMGFCEFFGEKIGEMHAAIERTGRQQVAWRFSDLFQGLRLRASS